MNTAQLSVLPDDLAAVSLTPLRRAVQRVRTFGARFSELAMPWTAAPGARGQAMDLTLGCLLYTSPSPRDQRGSRMPSSA